MRQTGLRPPWRRRPPEPDASLRRTSSTPTRLLRRAAGRHLAPPPESVTASVDVHPPAVAARADAQPLRIARGEQAGRTAHDGPERRVETIRVVAPCPRQRRGSRSAIGRRYREPHVSTHVGHERIELVERQAHGGYSPIFLGDRRDEAAQRPAECASGLERFGSVSLPHERTPLEPRRVPLVEDFGCHRPLDHSTVAAESIASRAA